MLPTCHAKFQKIPAANDQKSQRVLIHRFHLGKDDKPSCAGTVTLFEQKNLEFLNTVASDLYQTSKTPFILASISKKSITFHYLSNFPILKKLRCDGVVLHKKKSSVFKIVQTFSDLLKCRVVTSLTNIFS